VAGFGLKPSPENKRSMYRVYHQSWSPIRGCRRIGLDSLPSCRTRTIAFLVRGIFLAAAAATDAYVSARLAGHPVISLLVGHAISGGFLTHGAQANRLLAFNDSDVTVHAMAKNAAARVTRRTVEELDKLAETVIPMSYKIEDYAKLGALYKLIDGVNVDSPEPKQVDQVRADLLAAIADARSGQRDLSDRLRSQGAQKNRSATLAVRKRLAAEWHSN
jgi:malonate decarboxylase gamma subunit